MFMGPWQIALVVIIVLILVVGLMTYFMRNRYYEQINSLDEAKNEVLKNAPYDELKEVATLNITGQSYELRKTLERKWREIETVKYPHLENHLFDAEQATDRYRLGESKRSQTAADEAIEEINVEIRELKEALNELIEREQANLVKIDRIKKRYHEIRKSLLAYSFSFGPASISFEKKLGLMEDDFTDFSEYTVTGDHEEANKIVGHLNEVIEETEQQMAEIPPLLEELDDVYEEEIKDLKQGYDSMVTSGYIFPDDTILDDIAQLEEDKQAIYDSIRELELEKANEQIEALSQEIDKQYNRMELEVEAKPAVAELLEDTKRAIYYLQEEQRRQSHLLNRLTQSYVLIHNETVLLEKQEAKIVNYREEFDTISEQLKGNQIPFSVAYQLLSKLFDQLDHLNDEYVKIGDDLDNYRKEEVELKDDMLAMEQTMYELKRELENERLPGLPTNYLELFFSTTDRIEALSAELARPKIQLIDIRKMHKMCTEDVEQLREMTKDIIRQVELIERTSQRLYRYKDTHKGVLETIRYSESLFTEDYDYDISLRLLREKMENVDPGVYADIVSAYENELTI